MYFYPRSPCGERLFFVGDVLCTNPISIHALLAESDSVTTSFQGGFAISIHALLAESDGRQQEQYSVLGISIHALLAESDPHIRSTSHGRPDISIHALLAESDGPQRKEFCIMSISIHALLAESDKQKCGNRKPDVDFYPRSPCGERPEGPEM